MSDEQNPREVLGLELTFIELMVLPLLRGVTDPVPVLELLQLETAADGSLEARSGLASLAVRHLVEIADEEMVAAPVLVLIADIVVEAERSVVVTLETAATSSDVHVLERGDVAIMHRQVAGGIHLFTPLEVEIGAQGLAERLGSALADEDDGRLSIRVALEGGVATGRPMVQVHPMVDGEPASLADRIAAALREPR